MPTRQCKDIINNSQGSYPPESSYSTTGVPEYSSIAEALEKDLKTNYDFFSKSVLTKIIEVLKEEINKHS